MRIGIDLDGVLVGGEVQAAFVRYLMEKVPFNAEVFVETHDWVSATGWNHTKLTDCHVEFLCLGEALSMAKPVPGAQAALHQLQQDGCDLFVVTACSNNIDSGYYVEAVLQKLFPDIGFVKLCCGLVGAKDAAVKLHGLDWLIDDSVAELKRVVEECMCVRGLQFPAPISFGRSVLLDHPRVYSLAQRGAVEETNLTEFYHLAWQEAVQCLRGCYE